VRVRFAELEKVMKKVARTALFVSETHAAMQSGKFLYCFGFAKIKSGQKETLAFGSG
jgi:uncharacterized protein (DUF169 family)